MRETITKEEYMQVLGLMLVARNAYKVIKECEKSYGNLVDMTEDPGSFGHFSDEIFGDGDADKALKNEGITIIKTSSKNK